MRWVLRALEPRPVLRHSGIMPYLYSEEQEQFQGQARRLLDSRFDPAALKRLLEQKGGIDDGFWSSCKEMGWTAITTDEAHGGLGMGLVDLCLIQEMIGRVTAGAPFLAANYAAATAISLSGDAEAGDAYLGRLSEGVLRACLATTEGADVLPKSPTARISNGRLTGTKTAVAGGASADIAVVYASAESGPVLGIVELGDGEVRREPLETIDNSRNLADLHFDGVSCRVLTGDGRAIAETAIQRVAVAIASEQVGGADACLEKARDYANDRVAFGQKIGRFQAVKHSLAEMYVLNEIARASVLDAAMRSDGNDPDAALYAAAARVNAIKAYEYASQQATQVHGGIGVTWEGNMHLHYRRSRSLATEWGSRSFWEDMLVRQLEARQ